MARFPGAVYRPLSATQTQGRMSRHDIVCLHTMVGYLTSTDAMFRAGGYSGTESHFGVGGKWGGDVAAGFDGKIYQWQDTTFTADANLDGNHRVISIETADNAPKLVKDIQDWTPKQIDAIVKIIVWACKEYDIPPVLIPDSKPGRRGIGYHRQGCEHSLGVGKVPGFLVAGGERWSSSEGKECPGPRRIAQIKAVIIPRVQAALAPKPPVKEPTVAEPNLMDQFRVLLNTDAEVNAMNLNNPKTPFVKNQWLSADRLLTWGGPGMERLYYNVLKLRAEAAEAQEAREATDAALQRIEDQLAVLAARTAPPTETGAARSV